MNVCYIASYSDSSGYGEAGRNFIYALNSVNVDIKPQNVQLIKNNPPLGKTFELCNKLAEKNKNIEYKIKIVHTTPDIYMRFIETNKYHIGHLFWETDRITKEWVWNCNRYDEIWTATQTQRAAFIESGVRVPIYIFPQPINVRPEVVEPLSLQTQGFVFYSIFEWIERKNPETLIKSFFDEFRDIEVTLLIKIWVKDNLEQTKQIVIEKAKKLKEELKIGNLPKLLLIFTPLNDTEILQFHCTGSCFVSAHRGEGWGRPQMEAMIMGNPIISTGYNGIHDYLGKRTAYLVEYDLVPIKNPHSKYYDDLQNWAEIKYNDLRAKMRYVFEHQKEAAELGLRGREYVRENFNYYKVGHAMKERLLQIEKNL